LLQSLMRGGCLQEVPNIAIWRGDSWYLGKLVAGERWSFSRDGCNWKFHSVFLAVSYLHAVLESSTNNYWSFHQLCWFFWVSSKYMKLDRLVWPHFQTPRRELKIRRHKIVKMYANLRSDNQTLSRPWFPLFKLDELLHIKFENVLRS